MFRFRVTYFHHTHTHVLSLHLSVSLTDVNSHLQEKISMGEGGHLAMFLLMVVIESLAKKEKERSRDYLLTIRSQ